MPPERGGLSPDRGAPAVRPARGEISALTRKGSELRPAPGHRREGWRHRGFRAKVLL